jgi:hypothetical protein
MKRVFDNAMCAHVWAQQSQPNGRSNSMRFDGPYLYSYSTAIGYIPDGAKYGLCALLTSNTYSMTTSSKHMPAASRAVRGRDVFCVPNMGADPGACKENLAHLVSVYHSTVARALRMQSWYWLGVSDVRNSLEDVYKATQNFAERFKLPAPVLPVEADTSRIWARCERLTAERAKPEYQAKTEKKRAQRDLAAVRKAEEKRAEQAEARRIAALDSAERVRVWLAGAPIRLHHNDVPPEQGALLRLVGDTVETSMGAEAPAAHVRLALKKWRHCVNNGADWHRNGEQFALGQFQLDSIDGQTGTVRAGCHTIYRETIERLEAALA